MRGKSQGRWSHRSSCRGWPVRSSGGSFPASTWEPGAAPCGQQAVPGNHLPCDLLTGALGTKLIAKCSIESLAFSIDESGAGGQGSSDQRLSQKWSFWEAELMLGALRTAGNRLRERQLQASGSGARLGWLLPIPQLRSLGDCAGPWRCVFLRVDSGLSAHALSIPL